MVDAVVVDVVNAVHLAGSLIKERIEASRNLPEVSKKCISTIDQIEGAVDGVGDDRATAATLATIRERLDELQELIERMDAQGDLEGNACGRCFKMMKRGKDVLRYEQQLEAADAELRKQLGLLSTSTDLAKYATRRSNVLKQRDARKFWDSHFGEDRDVSIEALGEALEHEVAEQELDVDVAAVVPICRAAFAGQDRITVLQFGKVFCKPIPETLVALSKRTVAASHMVVLRVFRMPSRERDGTVDAGMLMCRETDTLAALRQLIKKHAATLHEEDEDDDEDDDVGQGGERMPDPALDFLREGKFVFFLDNCDVRVRKKQETTFEGVEYLDRVALVRSSDLPKPARAATSSSLPGAVDGDRSRRGSEPVSEVSEADELDIAEAVMNTAMESKASALNVDAALETESLSQQLKRAAIQRGIGEEALTFLGQLKSLKTEAASSDGGSESMEGLRSGAWAMMERYFVADAVFKLPLAPATMQQTESRVRRSCAARIGTATTPAAVVENFAEAAAEVEDELSKSMESVRKAEANQGRVLRHVQNAGSVASKTRVVVVGGGWLGITVAKKFDLMDDFHCTLVDPKEYFEDNTAQPPAIVSPGKSLDDAEAAWPRTVVKYKGKLIQNGTLLTGFLSAVGRDHVQVGSRRAVVPYDYLVLATGSSYSSNIKAPNASLEYRHKQMVAENRVLLDAKSVLVIGGGLVGCEIATEIKATHPDKTVTIVQRNAAFLPRIEGAHELIVARMDELGVCWHVGQSIDFADELNGRFTSRTGKVFEADKVYHCEGLTPNTGFLHDSQTDPTIRASLDRRSFVRVNAHCQIEGAPHVFAGGDMVADGMHLTTGPAGIAERTAHGATCHGAVIAENIIRLEAKRKMELDVGALTDWNSAKELRSFRREKEGPHPPYMMIGVGGRQGLLTSDAAVAAAYAQMMPSFGIEFETPQSVLDGAKVGISKDGQNLKDAFTGMAVASFSMDWRLPHEEGGSGGEHMFIGMAMMEPAVVDPKAPGGDGEAPEELEPEPEPEPIAQHEEPIQSPVRSEFSDAANLSVPEIDAPTLGEPSPRKSEALRPGSGIGSAEAKRLRARAETLQNQRDDMQQKAKQLEKQRDEIRTRAKQLEEQRDDLQRKVDDAQGNIVRERLRADCAEQELDSERRLREGMSERLQLMERDAARPTQAQLPVAAPKQSPAASGVVASDDQPGTLANLALALSTNAQTIHHLVKGGRLAP